MESTFEEIFLYFEIKDNMASHPYLLNNSHLLVSQTNKNGLVFSKKIEEETGPKSVKK